MKKLLSLVLALIMILSLVACGGGNADDGAADGGDAATDGAGDGAADSGEEKIKVALMLPGDKNDAGWNQSAYEGLLAAEAEYGVEIAYTEGIDQVNYESTAREYAATGYDLVLMIGGEFADTCTAVGPEYPETIFACFNGNTSLEPNVASYRYTTTETGFLCGAIAALLSETGTVGYIVGSAAAHISDSLNAFDDGVKYINPDYTALQVNIDSMSDVALAKESTKAMIDQGADVVIGNANTASLGVIEAADEAGIMALGVISDQYDVAPETVKVSVVQDNATMVMAIVKSVVDGSFTPAVNLFGIGDGAIYVSDWHGHDAEVAPEVLEKIDEIIAGISDGSLKEAGILPKTSFE